MVGSLMEDVILGERQQIILECAASVWIKAAVLLSREGKLVFFNAIHLTVLLKSYKQFSFPL